MPVDAFFLIGHLLPYFLLLSVPLSVFLLLVLIIITVHLFTVFVFRVLLGRNLIFLLDYDIFVNFYLLQFLGSNRRLPLLMS